MPPTHETLGPVCARGSGRALRCMVLSCEMSVPLSGSFKQRPVPVWSQVLILAGLLNHTYILNNTLVNATRLNVDNAKLTKQNRSWARGCQGRPNYPPQLPYQ